MKTLWVRFPEDTIAARRFMADEREKLEEIFSTKPGSPWRQATALLNLTSPKVELITWHHEAPYFNWSAFAATMSGSAIEPIPSGNGHTLRFRGGLWRLLSLLKSQWNITRADLTSVDDDIVLSLALGIRLQAYILRLGADHENLARLLADPSSAQAKHRKLLADIQSIQMRRTQLSPAWHALFGFGGDITEPLPDFFWDTPPTETTETSSHPPHQTEWRGLTVSPGLVTGLAIAVERGKPPAPTDHPQIFVFRNARPDTVEYFPHAVAVLYAEGGALSHACTVAREQNLPCITRLGADFYEHVKNNGPLWVTVDAETGKVTPQLLVETSL